jgi:hypothetical protein
MKERQDKGCEDQDPPFKTLQEQPTKMLLSAQVTSIQIEQHWRKWIKPLDYLTSQITSLGNSPTLEALLSHFTLFYLNKLSCFTCSHCPWNSFLGFVRWEFRIPQISCFIYNLLTPAGLEVDLRVYLLGLSSRIVTVPHTCHPSYSGSRDRENCGSRVAQAKSLWDPYLNQ